MGESTEENLRKDGEIKKPDAVTQMHAAAVNGDKALLAKIIVCECQVAYQFNELAIEIQNQFLYLS